MQEICKDHFHGNLPQFRDQCQMLLIQLYKSKLFSKGLVWKMPLFWSLTVYINNNNNKNNSNNDNDNNNNKQNFVSKYCAPKHTLPKNNGK